MKKWKIMSILAIVAGALLIGGGFLLETGIVRDCGMFFIPIGIAFYSIHLSKQSGEQLTQLGNESNYKLTTIANATFMEIVDIFEDKRIQFWQHPEWLGLEGTIWKCKTYVDRGYDLHKSTKIDDNNRHRLFQWFNYLINKSGIDFDIGGRPYKSTVFEEGALKKVDKFQKLKKQDVGNILEMVKKFRDFDLSDEDLKQLNIIEKTVKKFYKEMENKFINDSKI